MPTYEYQCDQGHYFERVLMVKDYQVPQICDCGSPSKKLLSRPSVVKVAQDVCYSSPIDGRPITSWAQRKEDMQRSGCVEYDPEIKKDQERRLKREEKELEDKVDATVEEEIMKMDPRKQEKLYSELSSGVSAEVVRQ